MSRKIKVGIITHFYNTINYGGILQAYALCHFLEQERIDSEQICYGENTDHSIGILGRLAKATPKRIIQKGKTVLYRFFCRKTKPKEYAFLQKTLSERHAKFNLFSEKQVSHSIRVFDDTSITECVDNYDVFITGSDQVWNFSYFRPAYFLGFVPDSKPKFAYAASMGDTDLSSEQKGFLQENLNRFMAISVREKSTAIKLQELLHKPVEAVVDPTLLLDPDEWKDLCEERIINNKYLFCYFISYNRQSRELAKEFAKQHDLQIAAVYMSNDGCVFRDMGFADIVINADPAEFLSLIRYAEFVFTDSFHAVIFSNIFNKQYVVFKRNDKDRTYSRILDLSYLMDTEERCCFEENRTNTEYIESLEKIKYQQQPLLASAIAHSREYIRGRIVNQ